MRKDQYKISWFRRNLLSFLPEYVSSDNLLRSLVHPSMGNMEIPYFRQRLSCLELLKRVATFYDNIYISVYVTIEGNQFPELLYLTRSLKKIGFF